ncbi:MAG: hypothetical protein ACI4E1_04505 [Lachnospira sp.]
MATNGIGTNERLLCSDVTKEECLEIERILRRNNISYYEKWKFRTGIFKFIKSSRNSKCEIYIHKDSMDKAREILKNVIK